MLLDRPRLRVPATTALSLLAHAGLLVWLAPQVMRPGAVRPALTEVEYLEEVPPPPSEMEKLMQRIAPPPAPESRMEEASAVEEQLRQESFSKVVGLKDRRAEAEVTDADLTRLAALPKLTPELSSPAPQAPAGQRIALARSAPAPNLELRNSVVPLEDLPPADFGPGISQRGFARPEAIIRQVKAEQRAAESKLPAQTLSLDRGSVISGEVRGREVLQREYPVVPRWLEEKGVEAEVVLNFVVDPDGQVGDKIFVEKTSGYAELDRLAMASLKKWSFAPLPLTARQAEQRGTIVIRFRLRTASGG